MSILFNNTGISKVIYNGVELSEVLYNGVSVFKSNIPLAEATWSQIAAISAAGKAPEMWAIGDTKTFELTDGRLIEVAIADFNHDDLADGSGKAGVTFIMTHCLPIPNGIRIHSAATNVNIGWDKCEMRVTTLPTWYALFPQDLRDAIKTVHKPTSAGWTSTIINSADNIWIPSEKEWFNTTAFSYGNEGTYYAEYAQIRKQVNYIGYDRVTECSPWLRSPSTADKTRYAAIMQGAGTSSYNWAANSNQNNRAFKMSVFVGFCV